MLGSGISVLLTATAFNPRFQKLYRTTDAKRYSSFYCLPRTPRDVDQGAVATFRIQFERIV